MTNIALNLVNSIWFIQNGKGEILNDRAWVEDHLSLVPLSDLDWQQANIDELVSLRTLMTDVLKQGALNHRYKDLEACLSRAYYVPKGLLSGGSVTLKWTCLSPGQDQLISELAQDLMTLFSEKKIEHLKRCSNDECHYYYIDHSKNKSKKYCSSKCGNLMKVRRFRAKA